MRYPRFMAAILITLAAAGCSWFQDTPAEPAPAPAPAAKAEEALRPVDAEIWTRRIQSLLPAGWSVTRNGDTILVARDQPVQLLLSTANGPGFVNAEEAAAAEKSATVASPYILKFVFEPFIPVDEYNRRRAANAAAAQRKDQLQKAINDLPHMGDSYSATTPEQTARLAAYNQAVAQLTFYSLPNFYCPHYSVTLWEPDRYSSVQGAPASECAFVKSVLISLFTPYP